MITSAAALPAPYKTLVGVNDVEIMGIPTTIINVPYANEMSFAKRIRAFFEFAILASREVIRCQADVVFATSTPLTIAIPAIVSKTRWHIPMIFEVRDLWPELPIAVGALRNPMAKALARILEWIAYHASTHIVALSPGMADGIMSRGIHSGRVTVIPNSCDVNVFAVPSERGTAFRQRLGLVAEQPLIVYAGSLGMINGTDYLVEIAAAMKLINPQIHFLIVGSGAERNRVSDRAKRLRVLGENLSIWEPIPKAQMPDLLAAATISTSLFIPLRQMWNNSANKFFDALAAGKPIAINYGGWQARVLEESGAGIVLPPEDPAQGAVRLDALVRDSQRLQHMASAARELAHTRFSRDQLFQNLEAILYQATQND
jgi:glycosyltransferase involved in cell wall biosynthesis